MNDRYLPNIDLNSKNETLNFTHACAGYMEPTSTGSYDQNKTRRGTVMLAVMLEDAEGNEAVHLVTYSKDGVYTGNYKVNTVVESEFERPVITPDQGGNEGGDQGGSGESGGNQGGTTETPKATVVDSNGNALTAQVTEPAQFNPAVVENIFEGDVVAYDITVPDFTGGTAFVTIDIPSGMDANKFAIYYVSDDGKTTEPMTGAPSGDGKYYTFEATHFSVYVGGEKIEENAPDYPVIDEEFFFNDSSDLSSSINYKLVTQITSGKQYLIVGGKADKGFYMLTNTNGDFKTGTAVTIGNLVTEGNGPNLAIKSGDISLTNDTDVAWTVTVNDGGKATAQNGNYYLNLVAGKTELSTDPVNLSVHNNKALYLPTTDTTMRSLNGIMHKRVSSRLVMKSKKQMEPYISTYLHSKGRKLGIPVAGNFELTARCNFNCPMCYVHMTPQQLKASGREELTAQQWLDIARAAKEKGMLFVLLTGGEPLVRKDFFEIYDGMREMGLLISINSNGSMLQGEILERFLKTPPFRFNISLYGGSNETYRNMCGLPAYDQVKENIRRLRQAGVEVSLNLSITPYNKDDLAQIYRDAVELDVNVRASSYMYPSVRVNGEQYGCGNRLSCAESAKYSVAWDALRFNEEEFAARAEALMRLEAIEQEGCPLEEGDGVRCRAGSTSFWMTWDGKMMPCGMLTTPVVYPLEIGFDAAWEQIRTETAKIRTPAKCTNCGYKDICGACAAVYYTETGAFDAVPEYVCRRAEEIVKATRVVYEERKQK